MPVKAPVSPSNVVYIVNERTGARKVRVEVKAGRDNDARRWLLGISGQKTEDIVAAAVSGLDHQAQVGRESTVVGGTGCLVVLVRAGKVIRELARSLLDFALIIGLSIVFMILGQGLHFIDRMGATDKSSIGDTL